MKMKESKIIKLVVIILAILEKSLLTDMFLFRNSDGDISQLSGLLKILSMAPMLPLK